MFVSQLQHLQPFDILPSERMFERKKKILDTQNFLPTFLTTTVFNDFWLVL